jgi:hypothetical protein
MDPTISNSPTVTTIPTFHTIPKFSNIPTVAQLPHSYSTAVAVLIPTVPVVSVGPKLYYSS